MDGAKDGGVGGDNGGGGGWNGGGSGVCLSSDKCTYCKLLWIKAYTKCHSCKCEMVVVVVVRE